MSASYQQSSPWFRTPFEDGHLSLFSIRPVSAEADDILYTIEPQYNLRPDLLSYDLYGTSKLWWVFTQRNLDVIEDPIFGFVSGVQIYLPKKESLFSVLGL